MSRDFLKFGAVAALACAAARLFECNNVHKCPYKYRRQLWYYRVAQSTQLSHSSGYPCSQRLKAGFKTPNFAVAAGDEFVIIPRAMPPINGSSFLAPLRLVWPPFIMFGVG